MNTYNDNLRSIVFDSLQKQELDQKKLTAQLKASKISLYYSQGARINAQEKLDAADIDLKSKTKVKEQSVINANLSTNLAASADQEKTYMDLAVTNAATCASNVQIAANAVLKLASDVGSIYSIVNAADYGEEIYDSAKKVKELMDQTAYHAEVASQNAMEASEYTAAVPYKKVASLAKSTDTAVKGVLDIADAEFNKSSSLVASDTNVVSSDSNKEKVNEGKLEDINVDYNAAIATYRSMNTELNLDLQTELEEPEDSMYYVPSANSKTGKQGEKELKEIFVPKNFTVKFNSIISPFQTEQNNPREYPVKNYYAILVKYRNRSTFNLAKAENLLQKVSEQYPSKKFCSPVPFTPNTDEVVTDPPSYSTDPIPMSATIDFDTILDSDGELFQLGQNYVVFIYAQYADAYKRIINDFEDFLSVPSPQFVATRNLAGPLTKNIEVTTEELDSTVSVITENLSVQVNEESPINSQKIVNGKDSKVKPLSTTLSFTIDANANSVYPVEYRCMFLPTSPSLTKGLLTKNGLRSIEAEIRQFEKIYASFDKALLTAQKNLDTVLQTISEKENIADLEDKINKLKKKKSGKDSKFTKQDQNNLDAFVEKKKTLKSFDAEKELEKAKTSVNDVIQKRDAQIEQVKLGSDDALDFFFDIDLAEMVSAANYFIPKHDESQDVDTESSDGESITTQTWTYQVKPSTTDNFGSPLIAGNEYIPVVLTVSAAQEINLDKYTNALTPYEQSNQFTYQTIVTKSKK